MNRSEISGSTIKEWPKEDRPREKLLKHGSHVLSDAELLALQIGSGTRNISALDLARGIVHKYSGLPVMAGCTAGELLKIKGIGPAAAARILSAFEIGRRADIKEYKNIKKITCVEDVVSLYRPIVRDLKREIFRVILLNSANRIIVEKVVTEGILNASLVHPREVFKIAVDYNAASIIVIHNHPSGNAMPSQSDVKVTEQLEKAGKVLGIPLTDHVIITKDSYFSFAQRKLLNRE